MSDVLDNEDISKPMEMGVAQEIVKEVLRKRGGADANIGKSFNTGRGRAVSVTNLLVSNRNVVLQHILSSDPDLRTENDIYMLDEILVEAPCLKSLTLNARRVLARSATLGQYDPGQEVVSAGALVDTLMVVLSGEVILEQANGTPVTLKTGHSLGEWPQLSPSKPKTPETPFGRPIQGPYDSFPPSTASPRKSTNGMQSLPPSRASHRRHQGWPTGPSPPGALPAIPNVRYNTPSMTPNHRSRGFSRGSHDKHSAHTFPATLGGGSRASSPSTHPESRMRLRMTASDIPPNPELSPRERALSLDCPGSHYISRFSPRASPQPPAASINTPQQPCWPCRAVAGPEGVVVVAVITVDACSELIKNEPNWSVDGIVRFLEDLPTLATLSRENLVELARLVRVRHVEAGQVVFRQGSENDDLFMVRSGYIRMLHQMQVSSAFRSRLNKYGEALGAVSLSSSNKHMAPMTPRTLGKTKEALFAIDKAEEGEDELEARGSSFGGSNLPLGRKSENGLGPSSTGAASMPARRNGIHSLQTVTGRSALSSREGGEEGDPKGVAHIKWGDELEAGMGSDPQAPRPELARFKSLKIATDDPVGTSEQPSADVFGSRSTRAQSPPDAIKLDVNTPAFSTRSPHMVQPWEETMLVDMGIVGTGEFFGEITTGTRAARYSSALADTSGDIFSVCRADVEARLGPRLANFLWSLVPGEQGTLRTGDQDDGLSKHLERCLAWELYKKRLLADMRAANKAAQRAFAWKGFR